MIPLGQTVSLGVPGLSVSPGTHICALFRGAAERDAILYPYVREGLLRGDKCLCAFDATDEEALRSDVASHLDLEAAGEQLDVVWPPDFYTGQEGSSPERMLDFWDGWAGGAITEGGYSFARSIGEMTRAVSEVIGPDNLTRYESALNRFVPRYPQVMICLYDLDSFGGDLLVEILRTHPKVLLGGTVLENLYYLEPDDFLATRG
jgi:hypothetical protein